MKTYFTELDAEYLDNRVQSWNSLRNIDSEIKSYFFAYWQSSRRYWGGLHSGPTDIQRSFENLMILLMQQGHIPAQLF